MPMSRLFAGVRRDVLAVDEHRARRRLVEAGEQAQRGRLAAARRAEQREQLARLDPQVSPASAAIDPNTRRTSRYSTVVPPCDRGGSPGARRRSRQGFHGRSAFLLGCAAPVERADQQQQDLDEQQAEHRHRGLHLSGLVGSWASQTGNGLV